MTSQSDVTSTCPSFLVVEFPIDNFKGTIGLVRVLGNE